MTRRWSDDVRKRHRSRAGHGAYPTVVSCQLASRKFAPWLPHMAFLTSAAKRGASLFKMLATSRHQSTETLTGYVRDQDLFTDHAGAGLL